MTVPKGLKLSDFHGMSGMGKSVGSLGLRDGLEINCL